MSEVIIFGLVFAGLLLVGIGIAIGRRIERAAAFSDAWEQGFQAALDAPIPPAAPTVRIMPRELPGERRRA